MELRTGSLAIAIYVAYHDRSRDRLELRSSRGMWFLEFSRVEVIVTPAWALNVTPVKPGKREVVRWVRRFGFGRFWEVYIAHHAGSRDRFDWWREPDGELQRLRGWRLAFKNRPIDGRLGRGSRWNV
jgi:hypothetical protein